MPDGYDSDNEAIIVDSINDPVRSNSNSPSGTP